MVWPAYRRGFVFVDGNVKSGSGREGRRFSIGKDEQMDRDSGRRYT